MKRKCKQCGSEFEPVIKWHVQVYCSTLCNHRAQWAKRKEAYIPKKKQPKVYDHENFDWRDFQNNILI